MLTFGSLFAGIGGFDLGFERAGMTCVWRSEIDTRCNALMDSRQPDIPNLGDVRNVTRRTARAVDLVCGGFPCQDVSVAGKRAGLAGDRSGLWFEFHRVLAELAPRWVVIENVPGLLSSNKGRDFAVILRGLVQLGYRVCWRVLDAQYYGLAQRRRRVFIVGHLGDGRAAQVLLESEGGAWGSPPSRETGARVAGTLAAGAHPSGFNGRDVEQGKLIVGQCHGNNVGPMGELRRGNGGLTGGVPFVAFDRTRGVASGDISAPLRACGGQSEGVNDGKADTQCMAFNWQSGGDARLGCNEHRTNALHKSQTPAVMVAKQVQWASGGGQVLNDTAQALRSGAEHNYQFVAQAVSENQRAELRLTEYSRQITSGGGKPGQGYPAALTQYGVRRLTPTECERLQGFPDGWTAGQSDTQRYKQLGNAIAVPVAEWIGRRIVEVV